MNEHPRRTRWRMVAAVVVPGVAALLAVLSDTHGPLPKVAKAGPPTSRALAVPNPSQASAGKSAQPAAPLAAAPVAADSPSLDVPSEEWQKVSAALSATPEGRQQLARVHQWLSFQHGVQRWEAMRQASAESPQRLVLAQQLMDDVPTHLSRAEITGPEALALESQLAQDIVPDPTTRVVYLQTQLRVLQTAQPNADAQDQERLAAYKVQETAITSRWLAQPPAQRDPQRLVAQLDAVRTQVFDQP